MLGTAGLITLIVFVAIVLAGTLLSLILLISLGQAPRSGLTPETIDEAVRTIRATRKQGWALIKEATNHVDQRMVYCRRNNLLHYRRAYKQGRGFRQQMAFSLCEILQKPGFEARPVQAIRCRFADGSSGGHSWVEVNCEGEIRQVDALLQDPETGALAFEPITKVTGFSPLFRFLSGWGSSMVNAIQYLRTGRDDITF